MRGVHRRGGGIVLEGVVATVSIERIYRVNWTSFILCSTKTHLSQIYNRFKINQNNIYILLDQCNSICELVFSEI